jgi:hypothetical protein
MFLLGIRNIDSQHVVAPGMFFRIPRNGTLGRGQTHRVSTNVSADRTMEDGSVVALRGRGYASLRMVLGKTVVHEEITDDTRSIFLNENTKEKSIILYA